MRGGLSPVSILCGVIEVLPSFDVFSAKTSENSMTNEWSSSHSATCKSAALKFRVVHNSSSCPLQSFSLAMVATLGMFGWSPSMCSMRIVGCISPKTSPSCNRTGSVLRLAITRFNPSPSLTSTLPLGREPMVPPPLSIAYRWLGWVLSSLSLPDSSCLASRSACPA